MSNMIQRLLWQRLSHGLLKPLGRKTYLTSVRLVGETSNIKVITEIFNMTSKFSIWSTLEKTLIWIMNKWSNAEINTTDSSLHAASATKNCFTKPLKCSTLQVAQVCTLKFVKWLTSKLSKWEGFSFNLRSKFPLSKNNNFYMVWKENFKRKKTVEVIFLCDV